MPLRQRVARHFQGTHLPLTKQYLSYHDVCLTVEDMHALKEDWLTDTNIAFWQEWLEREMLPRYSKANIVLLRPTMTMLLMHSDLKSAKSALPSFEGTTHVFIPITDASAEGADRGTHWSLLVVSIIDRVAFHYDSSQPANYQEAAHCTKRLSKVLGVDIKFKEMDDTPQQTNNSDCGMYVCITMRHLLIKRLLNCTASQKVNMSMTNKFIDAKGGRIEMLKIIESLRKEGERRRRSASPYPRPNPDEPPRIE